MLFGVLGQQYGTVPEPEIGDWVETFSIDLDVNSGIGGNWHGKNIRQRIPPASLEYSGGVVRVTLQAADVDPPNYVVGFSISSAYIGHAAVSGDDYDFDGGQQQLLFSSSSGVAVDAGESIVSDETIFNLDRTRNLLIAVYFDDVSSIKAAIASGDVDMWTKTATDEAATTDVSSYALNPDACYLIQKIEIVLGSESDQNLLVATFTDTDTFYAHTLGTTGDQPLTVPLFSDIDLFFTAQVGGDVVFVSSFEGTDGATSATDDSAAAHTITFVGNAQLDTAQQKFGSTSVLLDGSGDWISVANHADFLFGAGPFTLEGFFRIADVTTEIAHLFGVNNVTGGELSYRLQFSAGSLLYQRSVDGSTAGTPINVASGMSSNTWHHVCLERNSSSLVRIYVDGVVKGSATDTVAFFSSSQPFTIGAEPSGGGAMAGHFDEVRVSRIAQYDGAFTPPSAPFQRPLTISQSAMFAESDTFNAHTVGGGDANLTQSAIFTESDTYFAATVASPHRYWRINITDIAAAGQVPVITEIQFHSGATGFGADQAEGGTPSADSENGGGIGGNWTAANAFDGEVAHSAANAWASADAAFPHWLAYDFGSSVAVRGVSILAGSAGSGHNISAPGDFTIQYSDNGSDWSTALTRDDETFASYEYRHFAFAGTEAYSGTPHGTHAHWRIVILEMDGSSSVAISEMEFRATPGGADQATGGTAAASSEFSGSFVAANAFANDGDSNIWHSAGGAGEGAWLRYSFASSVAVAQVTIQSRGSDDGTQPKTFLIQYADSSSGPWTTAWGVDGETGWSASETRTFTDPYYL